MTQYRLLLAKKCLRQSLRSIYIVSHILQLVTSVCFHFTAPMRKVISPYYRYITAVTLVIPFCIIWEMSYVVPSFLSLLAFIYQALVCGGAVMFASRMVRRFFHFDTTEIPPALAGVLGFGFIPAVISCLGLIGLFRAIPGMAKISGIGFGIFALLQVPRLIAQCKSTIKNMVRVKQGVAFWRFPNHPTVIMVPAALFATLIVLKARYCNFFGGLQHIDVVRDVLAVSNFSANYLKLAWLFDLSVPLSYGVYFFQTAAYLYSTVSGYSWPTLPLLVVNLAAVFFFFLTLGHLARKCFPDASLVTFIILVLAISLSGAWGLVTLDYSDYKFLTYIWPLLLYIYALPQYLMAMTYIMAGIWFLARFGELQHRRHLVAAACCFMFSLTNATPTGIWGVPMALLMCVAILIYRPVPIFKLYVRSVPPILICALIILGPEMFTFFARNNYIQPISNAIWPFNGPAIWPFNINSAIWFMHELYARLSPALFLGFLSLPVLLLYGVTSRSFAALGVAVVALITILGMIYIRSYALVVHWRGDLYFIPIIAGFSFTLLYVLVSRWERSGVCALAFITIALLEFPNIAGFTAQHQACSAASAESWNVNQNISLHDVVLPAATGTYSQWETIAKGGRSPMTRNFGGFLQPYEGTNTLDFLHNVIHWDAPFTPCTQTRYGESTPSSYYVGLTPQGVPVRVSCSAGAR